MLSIGEEAVYEENQPLALRRRGLRRAADLGTGVRMERAVLAHRGGISAVECRPAVPDLHHRYELFLHRRTGGRSAVRQSQPEGVPVGIRRAVSGGVPADGQHSVDPDAVYRLRRCLRLCLGYFLQRRTGHGGQVVPRQGGTCLRHSADGLRPEQLHRRQALPDLHAGHRGRVAAQLHGAGHHRGGGDDRGRLPAGKTERGFRASCRSAEQEKVCQPRGGGDGHRGYAENARHLALLPLARSAAPFRRARSPRRWD